MLHIYFRFVKLPTVKDNNFYKLPITVTSVYFFARTWTYGQSRDLDLIVSLNSVNIYIHMNNAATNTNCLRKVFIQISFVERKPHITVTSLGYFCQRSENSFIIVIIVNLLFENALLVLLIL